MEYCSKCKNISICKYVSEITDIENKINELTEGSHFYTITLRCRFFEQKSVDNIKTTKLNESNPMKIFSFDRGLY